MGTASAKEFANLGAERGLLGSMLLGYRASGVHIGELAADDWTCDEHRELFEALVETVGDNGSADAVTVSEAAARKHPGREQAYLELAVACTRATPAPYMAKAYAKIVREHSARRRAIALAEASLRDLCDPDAEIAPTLERLRQSAGDIERGRDDWTDMRAVLMRGYDYLARRAKGEVTSVTTGLPNVDRAVGGFFGGELTVVGARPAVGKSAFGLNVALQAAGEGRRVAFCSREMTDVQLGQRIMSRQSWVDGMKIRRAELEDRDWEAISDALPEASALPLEFIFGARYVEDLRAEIQRKTAKKPIDLLVVDYLQLMQTRRKVDSEYLRIGHVSRTCKEIATEFDVPVVALAQVGRATESRMPTLADLRGSGDIEQDADGVIFLHNPDSAEDKSVDPRDRAGFEDYRRNGYTYQCLGIAKQRQGVTGTACVLFEKSTMRYYTIARDTSGTPQKPKQLAMPTDGAGRTAT